MQENTGIQTPGNTKNGLLKKIAGWWAYVRQRWYRLAIACSCLLLVLGAITVGAVLLSNHNTGSQNCGFDTGYTCIASDIIPAKNGPNIDCHPESPDHEWYRTDRTLVIDPTDPNVMYVNVEWKGIFKSTDGGKTWTQKVTGIRAAARADDPTKGCYSEYPVIVIDPFDHNHLVVALSSGGGNFLGPERPYFQFGGVYQTFDGGEHWANMITNKMNTYVNDVAFDPGHRGTIYYTTSSTPSSFGEADQTKRFVTKGLIYKTIDNGKTWTELPSGTGDNCNATFIFINNQDANNLVMPIWCAKRLSADGTGTGKSTGKDSSIPQMGILHSTDAGQSWSRIASLGDGSTFMYGSPAVFTHMYLIPAASFTNGTTPYGLYTTDGATAQKTKYMDMVAYDPNDATGSHLFGYTTVIVGPQTDPANLSLWESNDAGATWHPYSRLPAEITDIFTNRPSKIVWDSKTPTTIYMSAGGGLVWKSTDTAKTWTKLLDYTMLPK